MTDQDDAIPRTFDEWRYCIEHHCGIPLTPEYAAERIQALDDPKNDHTQRFLESYGPGHHERVLSWFRRVASDQ